MIFLKALAVVLGLAFLLFGYFIYFKKKYNLINGFEADFQDCLLYTSDAADE